jgi:integrase
MEKHKDFQIKQKESTGLRWKENNLIFPSTVGTPQGPRNLYRHFIENSDKAGLPRIRFHNLRHTAATLMLREGIHPKVV